MEVVDEKKHHAAKRIQAQYRGHAQRKRKNEQDAAAIRLQAVMRGHLSRLKRPTKVFDTSDNAETRKRRDSLVHISHIYMDTDVSNQLPHLDHMRGMLSQVSSMILLFESQHFSSRNIDLLPPEFVYDELNIL
jgi:hypothetical protein